MPLLSIIVPAYNLGNYIIKSLNSIVIQNNKEIEIIVVNDGSNDNTEDLVKNYIQEKNLSNFFLYSKDNGGVSSARNFGIGKSVGDYLFFLDGDDLIGKSSIAAILDGIRNYNLPDVVHWPYDIVSENSRQRVKSPYMNYPPSAKRGIEFLHDVLISKSIYLIIGNVVYRRELIVNNGIQFAMDCIAGEDMEFTFRALSFANSVRFTRDALTFYVQRDTSTIHKYNIRKFDSILALKRVITFFRQSENKELMNLAEACEVDLLVNNYMGHYRFSLEQIIVERHLRACEAIRALNQDIERLYPGMRDELGTLIKLKNRNSSLNRTKIFQLSPMLYMHLAKTNERLRGWF